MLTPPETVRRSVTEVLHGETITDPYRWLEGDSNEVDEWTAAQNEYADELLDTDVSAALRDRFEPLARVTDYRPVRPAGGRYFQQIRKPDEEQHRLVVRDRPTDEPWTLVDPNEWSDDGTVSLGWYVPSPDGDRVAYGVAADGDEQHDICVVDVETGESTTEVPSAGRTGFAWDDEGFYYVSTGEVGSGGQLDKEIRHHELAADPDDDAVLVDDVDRHVWPAPETDDGTLVVTYDYGWQRSEVYIEDEGDLHPVLVDYDAHFDATLDDGTLYVLTDYEAPRSRLLACDVETARNGPLDIGQFTEVLAERESVLRSMTVAGESLLCHYLEDAHSRLTVFDRDGTERGEVSLPEYCTVSFPEGVDEEPEAFFHLSTFDRPGRICRVDLPDGEPEVLAEPDVGIDADLVVGQEWFESSDGTSVPAFVVHRADLELDGDNPTVLTGYGGFRIARTPSFDRFRAPFLEAGGVFVLANLRGGDEFGEPWHVDGSREHKQHTFDDVIAVAEGLIDRGYTRTERLAIRGGSNGGLLVGAAITQRSDLFGTALCQVPLLDMLRFHRFLLGESWTTEYGHPDDPDDFEYLRAYSPYHNVEGVAYPATLFTTAASDTRVHPSHARKMAARMQAATTGDAPIALRVETNTGHGVGKPTSMVVREQSEQWGFLCEQLGMDAAELS